jgi:hypothetical protein
MGNCKICGDPLLKEDTKENRTEHYLCRKLKNFKRKVSTSSEKERKEAFKMIIKKPNAFRKIFG